MSLISLTALRDRASDRLRFRSERFRLCSSGLHRYGLPLRRFAAQSVGLRFKSRVGVDRGTLTLRRGHTTAALLHDVSQFVADEFLSRRTARLVCARSEVQVVAARESVRAERGGVVVFVYAYRGEVRLEGRFHLQTQTRRQSAAPGALAQKVCTDFHPPEVMTRLRLTLTRAARAVRFVPVFGRRGARLRRSLERAR
jgi:hypothetical protein